MNGSIQAKCKPALILSVLMGCVIFTSCSAPPSPQTSSSAPEQKAPSAAAPPATNVNSEDTSKTTSTAPTPRTRPQLIKKATLTLIVDSVDKSVRAVSAIADKQQGDLIGLEDRKPEDNNSRHTASMQLRVPQERLESVLEELTKLGTIKNRSITAEDVGQQLVDFQARLTNLRATETNLQKIMDRAGSVKDILSVAKELSNVRQSIEQIDAQSKSLQNQVAYSAIALNLEAAVSSSSANLGTQIQETWKQSTHSFGELTFSLLQLGIWLMVYSPYFVLLAAAGYGFKRWRRRTSTP